MAENNEAVSKNIGIIPDFFHDIIAYIIPGYSTLILFACNLYIIGLIEISFINDIDIKGISFSLIVAYVIGRFFEQFGLITIHNKVFPFFGSKGNKFKPKYSLIFEHKDCKENNDDYTKRFQKIVEKCIKAWLLENLGEDKLLDKCKTNAKDDYFNLIRFDLRERYPSVAMYEKKQNANIVMNRSLAIIFISNILIYWLLVFDLLQRGDEINFSLNAVFWILLNLLFSIVLYKRFKKDKIYHAMYIFETFVAMNNRLSHPENTPPESEVENQKKE